MLRLEKIRSEARSARCSWSLKFRTVSQGRVIDLTSSISNMLLWIQTTMCEKQLRSAIEASVYIHFFFFSQSFRQNQYLYSPLIVEIG